MATTSQSEDWTIIDAPSQPGHGSQNEHGRAAFFYGTLMAPRIIHRVCYGSVPMNSSNKFNTRPAILHDHIRKRIRDADYPGVIPMNGATVRGTYVTGLTDSHIKYLDAFEGSEYTREKVSVRLLKEEGNEQSGEGNVESKEEYPCETYIFTSSWPDRVEDSLEDREWDFDEFMREKMHHWAGPEAAGEYEDVDKLVAAEGHDGTGGRGARGGNITAALLEEQKKKDMH